MKLLYIVLAVFTLTGCSTTIPSVAEYRISTQENSKSFTQSSCSDKSLKVAQAFSSSSLMTLNMNYGQGPHKRFVYTQSQWAESPNSAITAEILKSIKSTKLFKSVQVSKSRSNNNLLLETSIEDFMQYFSEDEKSSYANVIINLSLIDTSSNRVVATKTFDSKVEVLTIDADGGVVALNQALENTLLESVEWFGEVCK